nr:hypothetical protein [Vulcanimicrobium alpinum]
MGEALRRLDRSIAEARDRRHAVRIRKPTERPDEQRYVRVTLFAVPSTAFIPPPLNPDLPAHTQLFVPVDDERTIALRRVSQPERHAGRRSRGRLGSFRDFAQSLAAGPRRDESRELDGDRGFRIRISRRKNRWARSSIAVRNIWERRTWRSSRCGGGNWKNVRRFQAGEPLIGHDSAIPFTRLASEQRVILIGAPWRSVGAYGGEYAGRP